MESHQQAQELEIGNQAETKEDDKKGEKNKNMFEDGHGGTLKFGSGYIYAPGYA